MQAMNEKIILRRLTNKYSTDFDSRFTFWCCIGFVAQNADLKILLCDAKIN